MRSGHRYARPGLVSYQAGKIGEKIRLVTLRIILDTHSSFHMFRQEFECANRNAVFFNPYNSEDAKCELHVHSFTIYSRLCVAHGFNYAN